MKKSSIKIYLFGLLAIIQLYVPASMILEREEILKDGKEFKFKTAPIDPVDPFRGRYVRLSFDNNMAEVSDSLSFSRGETVYALLDINDEGFATITQIRKELPEEGVDFLKTKVQYETKFREEKRVILDFPFDRFYMEEFKAPEAEIAYRENALDTMITSYALVSIKAGEPVLKDVFIDNMPIKEYVLKYSTESK